VPAEQRAGLGQIPSLAEQEHDAALLARGQGQGDVQDRAGVEAGSEVGREGGGGEGERAAGDRLRPRNALRSPVAERSGSLACAKATRPAKSRL
jgi:hypothetical protein